MAFFVKILKAFKALNEFDRRTVYVLAALFGIYFSIDVISLARMCSYIISDPQQSTTFSGILHTEVVSIRKGYRITLSDQGERRTYSCEEPGISEFASCLSRRPEWEGQQASITSVPFPSGLLFGRIERPTKLVVDGSGTVYAQEFNASSVLVLMRKRLVFIFIKLAVFVLVIVFSVMVLNYYPRRK